MPTHQTDAGSGELSPRGRTKTRAAGKAPQQPKGARRARSPRPGGPTVEEELRREIAEFLSVPNGPSQIAVRLVDEGELTPWAGGGDTEQWVREPFEATVWIG